MKNSATNTTMRTNYFSKISTLFFLLVGVLISNLIIGQQIVVPFTSNGNFLVPAGVTSIQVEAWGGGGGGSSITSNRRGGGGGGGAYARSVVTVVPGNNYAIVIGAGGGANTNGSITTFAATTVRAAGGSGAASNSATGANGGTVAGSTGTFTRRGGNGDDGGGTNSGGGGGGAGAAGNGGDANNAVAGAGQTPGGNGGTGVSGNTAGNPGSTYGGGGSGASRTSTGTSTTGGSGANGYVLITYCPIFSLTASSAAGAVCANGTATINVTGTASSLPVGTYTVTYNRSAPNAATGLTASMAVTSAGAGSFTTSALAAAGSTTITITNLAFGTCTNAISANNTATVTVQAPTVSIGNALSNICRGANSGALGTGASVGGTATGGTWTVDVPSSTVNNATDITNATWDAPANFVGTATFRLTTTGGSCGTTFATKQLVVTAPTPTFTTSPGTYSCIGSPITYATQLTGSNFVWTISGTDGIDYTKTGGTSGDYTAVVTWLTTGNQTVTVNYTDGNGCTAQNPISNSTTVSSLPAIYGISGGGSICQGAATDITVANSETGVSYQLKNGATNVGTAMPGSNGIPVTISTGAVNADVTLTVVATNTTTNCSSTMTGTAAITVTAAPVVTAISNLSACNNEITPSVVFTGTPGATFEWSGTNNLAVGLAATTGTGDLPSFTATNNTNAAISSTITVTAFDGACYSAAPQKTFTLTTNPTPVITTTQAATVCSNAPFTVSPANGGGNIVPAGTVYTWSAPTGTGFSGGNSGIGTSITGTLINTTSSPVTAVYAVTSASSAILGSCAGSSFTVTITVNPRPAITTQNATACGGSAFLVSPADGGGNIVPTGTLYTWGSPTGTGFSGGATGANAANISGTLLNTTNAAATATYTVTATGPAGFGSCVAASTFTNTVTINPKPSVTTAQTATVCGNALFTVTPATGGGNLVPAGTVYNWSAPTGTNFSGGVLGTGTGSITGTLTNTTNAAATATYAVTPSSSAALGSCAGSPFNVVITLSPTPILNTIAVTRCGGAGFSITPVNTTDGIVPANTRYAWAVPSGAGFSGGATGTNSTTINGTLNNTTNNVITATYSVTPRITTGLNCTGAPFNVVVTLNPKPTVNNKTTTVCAGVLFTVSPTDGTGGDIVPTGTIYTFGAPTGTNFSVLTSGTGSTDINGTLTNTTANTATATYTVTPTAPAGVGGCAGGTFQTVVTLNPKPSIVTTQTATVCGDAQFTITPASGGGNIVPLNTVYNWGLPAGSGFTGGATGPGTTSITGTLANTTSGPVTATYTVTPSSRASLGGCAGSPFTATVNLNAKPLIATNQDKTICSGAAFNVSPVDAPPTDIVPSGVQYTWTTPVVSPGGAVTGSGQQVAGVASISQTLTNVTNATATVSYSATAGTGSCSTPFNFTVTVNPVPKIGNQTAAICNGGTFTVALANAQPTTIVPLGTTYSWAAPVIAPLGAIPDASAQTGQLSISQTLTNPTNAPATATYTVTPHGPDCDGATFTVTVTVNPTPTVTSAATANACSSIPQIPLNYDISGPVSGTTYNWGRIAVAGIAEGTVSGQTADPIMETLTNTTGTPIPVTYKITPIANGCSGPVFDLVVTVMPHTDAVITSAPSATICTPASINYTITSSGGPVTNYRWNRPLVAGITNPAVVNSVANPIIETLTNSSSSNATVNYTITAMNNGCPGDVFNYVVTVRPTLYLSNQTFEACSLQEFIFGPADASSGVIPEDTKFTWSAPAVTGGVSGWSSQSTPQDSVFQTLINPTSAIQTATYIVSAVSPTACVGGAFQLTVNVNPSVTVNASPTILSPVCSGSTIPTITVTSPSALAGTVLSWTRANTTNLSGMGATGNGDISGSLINNTATDQVETFTITATANGCSATTTVQVTIRPAATVAVTPASQNACSGEPITSIVISSPNGVSSGFTWDRDNLTDITGLASGSGDIIGFLVNTTSSQKTTIFTITPAVASCDGATITATVIVNPTPQVTATRNNNNPVCSGIPIEPITVGSSNTVIGTVFSWTRNNTTDITGNNSGTGALINEVFVNTTNVPQTTTITITATAGTCSTSTTMDVLVNPSPTILVSPTSQAVCSGSGISTVTLSDNLASTYSVVSRDNTTNITGTITGSTSLTGALTNTTTTTQITNLSVTATASTSGSCAATVSIPITVYAPLTAPSISESQFLCTGVNPTIFVHSIASSGGSGSFTYQWQRTTAGGSVWTNIATTMNYTALRADGDADYRVVVTDAACGNVTSNVLQIRLISTSQGGSLLGLQGDPAAEYCSSGTFTGTFLTLLHPSGYSLRYSWSGNASYISAPSGPAAGQSTGNTFGRIAILGIANSSGSIPLVFTNNTNATVTTTLALFPRVHSWAVAGANGTGGFLCNGAIENHIIAIKPTPVATRNTAQNQTICSETAANISVRSNITDESTRFTWTSSNTTTIQGLPASGDTTVAAAGTFRLLQRLTSTNTTAQTTTITITPRLTSATCNPGAAITYTITVNGNIDPGAFTAEQTVCSGGDPAAFVETVPAAGTTATTPTYVWQSAPGTCASPGTFANISGQTGTVYDIPSGINATRSYRRIVTFVSGVTCKDTTACVTVYVNTATAGSIATGNQTICAGSDPAEIGTVTPGSGAGAISYQWESKVGTGCTGIFTDVLGANSVTFTPPPGLAATTTYRRKTVSTLNSQDCASAVSNCFTVFVNSVDAGGIANLAPNNQIFCGSNNPVKLTSAPNATGTVAPTYQWQSSVGADCSGSFANVPSAGNGFEYDPPVLNATTTYRRIATSTYNTVACRDTTTCETITILNINPGQIANTQAVCAGGSAQPFISVTDATAGGSTDYRWESSTTGLAGSWTPIAGTNSNTYTHPGLITGTLYFHRVTFGDISGTPCDVATPSISIFLSDPTPGQIDAPLCNSLNPAAFTVTTAATGPGGALTYTWETSPNGVTLWGPVPDSTRATLDLNGLLPGTSYYRRIVTNTLIPGYSCSVTGNTVTLNAYDGTAGDWTGLNGTDWFNCSNWGAGALPDNSLNVTIPTSVIAPNQPLINDGSSYAPIDKMARTANLTIEGTINFATSASLLNTAGNLQILPLTGNINMPTGGTIQLAGNWVNNRGAAGLTGVGKLSLVGTGTQTINTNSASQTFYDLSMDKTGGSATMLADAKVDHQLTLNTGAVTTTSTPGLLTLANLATTSGGSTASFVNGPLAWETNSSLPGGTELVFPIGKVAPTPSFQHAMVVPITHSGTTTYTAEFFTAYPTVPYDILDHPFLGSAPIGGLLRDKYWDISKAGSGTAKVALDYLHTTTPSDWVGLGGTPYSTPLPIGTNVAVAHDSAGAVGDASDSKWHFTKAANDFNNSGPKYEARYITTDGWIYSAEMADFSPFTIGFASNTILPIKLIGFEGRLLGSDGALTWKISSASDLAGFELQYSNNGVAFVKLADIAANSATVYSYLDKQLPVGARFYRLLVKEKGGNSLHSAVIMLTLDGQKTSITGLSHTIVREQSVTGKIISAKAQGIRALISDVSGRQIAERRGRLQAGNNQWLINTGFLASGMYFVTILTDDGVKATLQFVKE